MKNLRQTLSGVKTVLYRRPKSELQRMIRWGPRAYFRCEAWARQMEAAAWKLEACQGQNAAQESGRPVALWFLTGRRFWYQTAFCAWTFARHSGRKVILNLVDDGTLLPEHEAGLRRLFPEGETVRKAQSGQRLETLLPHSRFPVLRQRWDDYINIRKLTDIHLGSTGWKLVLDSDMLFFRRPDALLAWWDAAQNGQTGAPCLMTDCVESYGYSRPLLAELAGAPIAPLLNVGVCGLCSDTLDWEELERWCEILLQREGTSYYLEQALVAMLAARSVPRVMSAADYITFPAKEQTRRGTGVLQHYVADSKPWYFGHAWKRASLTP